MFILNFRIKNRPLLHINFYLQGANKLPVSNAAEGTALFRQAWARRTETFTDYGPAKNHSTIVIQLDITLVS